MADDAVPGHHLRDRGQDEDDLLEYEREAEADEGDVLKHDGQHDGDDVRVDVLLVLAGEPAPGRALADLPDVLQAELVQDGTHVTVHVFIGKLGFCVARHMAAPVVVILTVVPRITRPIVPRKL